MSGLAKSWMNGPIYLTCWPSWKNREKVSNNTKVLYKWRFCGRSRAVSLSSLIALVIGWYSLFFSQSKSACKYGSKCYQQSGDHRQKFSHPKVSKWGVWKKNSFWHAVPFVPSWFFLTEKSCKLINVTLRIKPEIWKKKKERKKEAHNFSTKCYSEVCFVWFVFITIKSLLGNQTSKCTFVHQYRQVLWPGQKHGISVYLIFCFFVISQENEVVDSPSKGQVSKARNYWKHL